MKFSVHIEGDTTDKQSVSVLALLLSIAEGTVPNIPAFAPGTGLASGSGNQQALDAGDDDDTGPAETIAPGEVDVTGIPWNERIHAGTKSKNADGRWKKRKNVDEATITAVEAELRARMGNAPVVAASGVPPTSPAPVAAPPASAPPVAAPPASAPATATPPVAPPAAPPAPAPAPAAAPAGQLDFGGLMQIISNGMTADPVLINDEWVNWFAEQVGAKSLPEIAADPAKIKQVYDLIKQHVPAMNLA